MTTTSPETTVEAVNPEVEAAEIEEEIETEKKIERGSWLAVIAGTIAIIALVVAITGVILPDLGPLKTTAAKLENRVSTLEAEKADATAVEVELISIRSNFKTADDKLAKWIGETESAINKLARRVGETESAAAKLAEQTGGAKLAINKLARRAGETESAAAKLAKRVGTTESQLTGEVTSGLERRIVTAQKTGNRALKGLETLTEKCSKFADSIQADATSSHVGFLGDTPRITVNIKKDNLFKQK